MDIMYFTPSLAVGKFRLQIPPGQRTGDAEWIDLPEGIHQVQIINDVDRTTTVRYKETTAANPDSRVLFGTPSGETNIGLVVVPPGGGQIGLAQVGAVTAEDIAPPAVIHAGITVFLGTNETPE